MKVSNKMLLNNTESCNFAQPAFTIAAIARHETVIII